MSFLETLFGLSADVQYDPAYDQPTVRAQVMETLTQAYSFAQRTFGQGVSVDEVATVIQAVPGVVAVNVKEIHTVAHQRRRRSGEPGRGLQHLQPQQLAGASGHRSATVFRFAHSHLCIPAGGRV